MRLAFRLSTSVPLLSLLFSEGVECFFIGHLSISLHAERLLRCDFEVIVLQMALLPLRVFVGSLDSKTHTEAEPLRLKKWS
jgi:hypothetical protein